MYLYNACSMCANIFFVSRIESITLRLHSSRRSVHCCKANFINLLTDVAHQNIIEINIYTYKIKLKKIIKKTNILRR